MEIKEEEKKKNLKLSTLKSCRFFSIQIITAIEENM